tara:strand:- start:322 stop:720 length:399 start_codon:yes stop_codon:yes gene_type:complete
MELNFNHNEKVFTKALNTKPDLQKTIIDTFNNVLDVDTDNDLSRSEILERTMLALDNKGLIKCDQDLFNASFILGEVIMQREMRNKLDAKMEALSKKIAPDAMSKVLKASAEDILNLESIKEFANNDEPDEF